MATSASLLPMAEWLPSPALALLATQPSAVVHPTPRRPPNNSAATSHTFSLFRSSGRHDAGGCAEGCDGVKRKGRGGAGSRHLPALRRIAARTGKLPRLTAMVSLVQQHVHRASMRHAKDAESHGVPGRLHPPVFAAALALHVGRQNNVVSFRRAWRAFGVWAPVLRATATCACLLCVGKRSTTCSCANNN